MSGQGRSFGAVDHKRKMNDERSKEVKVKPKRVIITPHPVSIFKDKPGLAGRIISWMAPSDGIIRDVILHIEDLSEDCKIAAVYNSVTDGVNRSEDIVVMRGSQSIDIELIMKKFDRVYVFVVGGDPTGIWLSFHWVGGV